MPPLPKFEFKLETLIYYFQGALFLFIMSCFAYIIYRIIVDKRDERRKRRNNS